MFNNKINILKALAIMLVVSGHLEFALLGIFPPYSFHIALFFFISGYLFNEKYLTQVPEFLEKRVKGLLVPYFLYSTFYLGGTVLIAKLTGKFWGMPVTLKNFFITPFLNGHQLDLSCPLWFVPQLFISLVVFLFAFRVLKRIKDNKYFHLAVFLVLALASILLAKYRADALVLVAVRTMFSMFFIYLGIFYRDNIENKLNIFNLKWLFAIVLLQAFLWLFNKDYTPMDGIGLSYILVWGQFDDFLIPILTSLTGIWASLFTLELFYPLVKDNKFLNQMGKCTYHIMANHLFVFYIITAILLYIKGLPISTRQAHDIYWIYSPKHTTYFYFVVTMVVTTYVGVGLQLIGKKFKNHTEILLK